MQFESKIRSIYLIASLFIFGSTMYGCVDKKATVSNFQEKYDKSAIDYYQAQVEVRNAENVEACSNEMAGMAADRVTKLEELYSLAKRQREEYIASLVETEAESVTKADFAAKKQGIYDDVEKYNAILTNLEEGVYGVKNECSSKENEFSELNRNFTEIQEKTADLRLEIDPIQSSTIDNNHTLDAGLLGSEVEYMLQSEYYRLGGNIRKEEKEIAENLNAYTSRRDGVIQTFVHVEKDKKYPKGSSLDGVVLKNVKGRDEKSTGILGDFNVILGTHEKGGYDKVGNKVADNGTLDAVGNICIDAISLETQAHKNRRDVVEGIDQVNSLVEGMHTHAKLDQDASRKALAKAAADLGTINSQRSLDAQSISKSEEWYISKYNEEYASMASDITESETQCRSAVSTALDRRQSDILNGLVDISGLVIEDYLKKHKESKAVDGAPLWQILNHAIRQARELGDNRMVALTDKFAKKITECNAKLLAETQRFIAAKELARSAATDAIANSTEKRNKNSLDAELAAKIKNKTDKNTRIKSIPGLLKKNDEELTKKGVELSKLKAQLANVKPTNASGKTNLEKKIATVENDKTKLENEKASFADEQKCLAKDINDIEASIAALRKVGGEINIAEAALTKRTRIEEGARDHKLDMERCLNEKTTDLLQKEIERLTEGIKLLHQERISNAVAHGCEIKVGGVNLNIQTSYLDFITDIPPTASLGEVVAMGVLPANICCDAANSISLAKEGKTKKLSAIDYTAQLNFDIQKRTKEMQKYDDWRNNLKSLKIKVQNEPKDSIAINMKYHKQPEAPTSHKYGKKGDVHLVDNSTALDSILGFKVNDGVNASTFGDGLTTKQCDKKGTLWGENRLNFGHNSKAYDNIYLDYIFHSRPDDEAHSGLPVFA